MAIALTAGQTSLIALSGVTFTNERLVWVRLTSKVEETLWGGVATSFDSVYGMTPGVWKAKSGVEQGGRVQQVGAGKKKLIGLEGWRMMSDGQKQGEGSERKMLRLSADEMD